MESNISEPIAVGWVYGDHTDLEVAIAELTGIKPGHVPVFGLAGPNDLVQVLADIEGWKLIGTTVLSIYCTGIVSEAGKDTWRALAPRLKAAPVALKERFLKLVDALAAEQQRGQDVSIGLIEPTFDGNGRRDRIYLTDLSPEEVARHIFIFSHCVVPLAEWLAAEHAQQSERGQVGVEMKITDEGHLVATLVPGYGRVLRQGVVQKTFDSQGKLINEVSN
jgi:hypothetical protein